MFGGDSNGVLSLWQTKAVKKKKDGEITFNMIFIVSGLFNLTFKIALTLQ